MFEVVENDDYELPCYFYDNPRLPGEHTLLRMRHLMLNPDDAETILINAINEKRTLSTAEGKALHEIIEGDKDGEQDFLSTLGRIEREDRDDDR